MADSELGRLLKSGLAEYRRTFNFHGRSNRPQFWTFAVINICLAQAAMAIPMAVGFAQPDPAVVFDYIHFGLAAMLLLSIPYFSAIVRRLHDSGRSGWWALPQAILLSTGFAGFFYIFRSDALSDGLFGLLFVNNLVYLGWVALLLFFAVQPGEEGANRFGEPVSDD